MAFGGRSTIATSPRAELKKSAKRTEKESALASGYFGGHEFYPPGAVAGLQEGNTGATFQWDLLAGLLGLA